MIPSTRKAQNKEPHIDVINLIDVVFVLLIFFVMTTTFNKETGVDITKPSAGSATQLAKEPLSIGVTRDGAIYVNERQVDMATLSSLLKREASSDPDKSVVLVSDKEANMGTVVSILDECNLAGLKKVSVAANSQ
jgi:biopolymer transport protein ExbD